MKKVQRRKFPLLYIRYNIFESHSAKILLFAKGKKQNKVKFQLKIRPSEKGEQIWDEYRGKWIVNTPEEEVRQFVAWYIHHELGYPKSWIAVEKGIKHLNKQYRFDIVVFGENAQPVFLVECKRPSVPITQSTFDQIFKYNIILNVPYLLVSNGTDFYGVEIKNGKPNFLTELPKFQKI
ncbi:type I restriction enzyme HsdR N-terminal domain-containing protein [Luteibaculum oceani]|uniref:type I restriction enzyme HsdR N-terminal domain-containing protein n=1 Tax=Luteibaculum oceani TaxID=1294296 RepID=UPI001476981E|nr:type I restriction enzyme HsdR N-terminal domain-containing protein [Luteibaculum oceani]